MHPLVLTGLWPLMTVTGGNPAVVIALIDGPVADHADLDRRNIRTLRGRSSLCTDRDSMACRHGTFIAGILNARRGSQAPAICPGCTLLLRPIFLEYEQAGPDSPSAFPVELAKAIKECIDQGARIINLSIEIVEPCPEGDAELTKALDHAADKGVAGGGGRREPGRHGRLGTDTPSLGDTRRRLRSSGQACRLFEQDRRYHQKRLDGARRKSGQHRQQRTAGELERYQHIRAFCSRFRGAAVVAPARVHGLRHPLLPVMFVPSGAPPAGASPAERMRGLGSAPKGAPSRPSPVPHRSSLTNALRAADALQRKFSAHSAPI